MLFPPTTPPENNLQRPTLFMAIDLSAASWKLGFSDGSRKPRKRTIVAGDYDALVRECQSAGKRFGLPDDAAVVSCYEAGRDAFSVHRRLTQTGVRNFVVDSSSIDVSRRARVAKSDRIDVEKLLAKLIRYAAGETGAWSVLSIPGAQDEDHRRLHRELERLGKERIQHRNRIRGLLATQGAPCANPTKIAERLDDLETAARTPLPPRLVAEVRREALRLDLVQQQIRDVEKERQDWLQRGTGRAVERVRTLAMLRGIGVHGAWILGMEFFGWRNFSNRRELGSAAGLTGTPFSSGQSVRDQGISKSGNRRVRSLMVELAWIWLRYQPDSALSRWFHERFGSGASRMRRVGIVALARKLLVALWRLVEHGLVPDGARFKPKPPILASAPV